MQKTFFTIIFLIFLSASIIKSVESDEENPLSRSLSSQKSSKSIAQDLLCSSLQPSHKINDTEAKETETNSLGWSQKSTSKKCPPHGSKKSRCARFFSWVCCAKPHDHSPKLSIKKDALPNQDLNCAPMNHSPDDTGRDHPLLSQKTHETKEVLPSLKPKNLIYCSYYGDSLGVSGLKPSALKYTPSYDSNPYDASSFLSNEPNSLLDHIEQSRRYDTQQKDSCFSQHQEKARDAGNHADMAPAMPYSQSQPISYEKRTGEQQDSWCHRSFASSNTHNTALFIEVNACMHTPKQPNGAQIFLGNVSSGT